MPPMKVVGQFTVEGPLVGGDATLDSAVVAGPVTIEGDAGGALGVGGLPFSHAVIAVGYGAHPLTQPHQVAYYAPILGNAYASRAVAGDDGYVIGFESALGIGDGMVLPYAITLSQAQARVGVGSSIERVIGVMTYDESAGTLLNVQLVDYSSALTLTGNWFLYYGGVRKSKIGPLEVSGTLTLASGEHGNTVDTGFLRIWGDKPTTSLGAWLALYGNLTPGARGLLHLNAGAYASPTGADNTITLQTAGGSTSMNRDGSWTFPAAINVGEIHNALGVLALSIDGATSAITVPKTMFSTTGNDTDVLRATSATTGYLKIIMANGGGSVLLGVDNAVKDLIPGGVAYDAVIRGGTGIGFSGDSGSHCHARITHPVAAATHSSLWIYSQDFAALKEVLVGPAASGPGGVGRVLYLA